MPDADAVRAMFTRIAAHYDVMNSLMTAGRHHAWRRLAAGAVAPAPPGPVLDLATGTGDLAIEVRRLGRDRFVIGADFSERMLAYARRKLAAAGEGRVALLAADALELPFAAGTFAAVVSAFLLRNLEDLARGVAEMRRVTRPGGLVVTLEIVSPARAGWTSVFNLYFRRVVPAIGAAVARDRQAYTYLPQSVAQFITPDELGARMERAGLRDVRYRRLALGTIALHVGRA
jgi:demethylmenaquinone methyltransferase / 2-methoxy-6-polyprenyl-1,4-benzoquinol methylase